MKRKMQILTMVILLGAMLPMQGMLPRTAGRVVQGGRAFGTTPTAAAKEFTLSEKVGKPSKRLISKKKSLVLAADSTTALTTVPTSQEAFQAGANEPKKTRFQRLGAWMASLFKSKTQTPFTEPYSSDADAAAKQKVSLWSRLMAYWFGRKAEAAKSTSPEVVDQVVQVESALSGQQVPASTALAQMTRIEPTLSTQAQYPWNSASYHSSVNFDISELQRFHGMGERLTLQEIEEIKNSKTLAWFIKEIKMDQNIGDLTLEELHSLLTRLERVHAVLQSIHFGVPGDAVNWPEVQNCRELLSELYSFTKGTYPNETISQLKKDPITYIEYGRAGGAFGLFGTSDIIRSLKKIGFSFGDYNKQLETE